MGDIIRALTEMAKELGIDGMVIIAAIIVLLAVGFAAFYVARWNERLVNQVLKAQEKIGELSNNIQALATSTIERNTVANNANTQSNLQSVAAMGKVVESVDKLVDAFGSDPLNRMSCKMELTPERIKEIQNRAAEQGYSITENQVRIMWSHK